ncbi:MAG: hypothetical protein ABSD62_00010 [Candidatus Limnocylindrales bacterium]|jgi:hypothetical protein
MAPSATAATTTVPSLASSPSESGTAAGLPQLIVLADGVQGGVGLWTYGNDGSWTAGASLPGATAIARDGRRLTLAAQGSLELRDIARPQDVAPQVGVTWPSQMPKGTISCVDRSDAGKTVVAMTDADGITFALVSADGIGGPLLPVPESPFGPSVAWLDADRVLVVSGDTRQIPRLTVLDTTNRSVTFLRGLTGVRGFAVSPDRLSLAAATESAVYVGSVSDLLADREPAAIATLGPSQVVWDLTLDGDGSRLAMLSGTEAADGTVADTHEVGYERREGSWAKIFDSPVPFTRASGQVWLI